MNWVILDDKGMEIAWCNTWKECRGIMLLYTKCVAHNVMINEEVRL